MTPDERLDKQLQVDAHLYLAERARARAEADDRHAALAVALTPVERRCRLQWVEQDGIRGRVMACRWGS